MRAGSPVARAGARAAVVLGCVVAAGPTGLAAQDVAEAAYQNLLSVSGEATSLAQSGSFSEAVAVLEDALGRCPPAAGGEACRRVALYTLGYVHHAAADQRPEERERLLQEASRYFIEVLNENPDFPAARQGLALAYRKMGAHEWQESELRTLAESDPTGRYHVVLGDYYREQGRAGAAEAAYRRAAELAPLDERPRSRLLSLYRSESLEVDGLLSLLDEWDAQFPDLAADGYELAMRRMYPESWLAAADVLPLWLGALNARDRVTPRMVAQIPEDWDAAPFASLRAYVIDPAGAELDSWWMEREERLEAVGTTALSLGRWALAEGSPRTAEAVWRQARRLTPDYSPAWIDLTAELATLYDDVPALDPAGSTFDELEKELFTGKGRAIGRRDYEAMLRFHSTLGIIYHRRGEWGSAGDPRSAIFQLEHAVRAAEDLAAETGLHQPLPEIRGRLAEALLRAGDTAAARAAFAAAGLASLEVDDLEGAAEALRSADAPGAARRGAAMAEAVDRWLETRRRIDAALSADGGVCDDRLLARIRDRGPGEPGEILGREAVARQRFKALADCARRATRGGPELAAEAIEEVVGTRTALVGVGDWMRLDEARRLTFGGFGQSVTSLTPTPTVDGPREGVVPLALPGEGRGVYLAAGADALTAARIVRELRPSEDRLELRLRDGEVTVIDLGRRSVEAVRTIQGVDRVRVR